MEFRAKKLASFLRDAVAEIAREIPTEDCGMVSITDAEVSTDASRATVYVSALHHPEKAMAFLERHRYAINERLKRRIKIRRFPLITFLPDERPERGNRIDAILRDNAPDTTEDGTASSSD